MREFVQAKTTAVSYDEGLRLYMISIYKYMGCALCLTGVISFFVANTPALLQLIFGTPLRWVAMLAPLFFVMYFSAKIWSMSPAKAKNSLWIFSGLMGLSLASVFVFYTGASIARTFFVTAGTFGVMSLYGYTTKKDLTGLGSFMIMGLFGIIIASVVNIFLKSPGLEFTISILGVLVFTVLTAYDVQKIKHTYNYASGDSDMKEKTAVMGALNLYMDFINLMLFLLRFMGDRR